MYSLRSLLKRVDPGLSLLNQSAFVIIMTPMNPEMIVKISSKSKDSPSRIKARIGVMNIVVIYMDTETERGIRNIENIDKIKAPYP